MRANHRLALLLLLLLAAVLAAWGERTAVDSPAAYAIQRKLVAAASEPEDGGVQAVKRHAKKFGYFRWGEQKGRTLFHLAARRGNVGVLEALLDGGGGGGGEKLRPLLDLGDNDGKTALWLACAGGKALAVRTLLQLGADPATAPPGNCVDRDGDGAIGNIGDLVYPYPPPATAEEAASRRLPPCVGETTGCLSVAAPFFRGESLRVLLLLALLVVIPAIVFIYRERGVFSSTPLGTIFALVLVGNAATILEALADDVSISALVDFTGDGQFTTLDAAVVITFVLLVLYSLHVGRSRVPASGSGDFGGGKAGQRAEGKTRPAPTTQASAQKEEEKLSAEEKAPGTPTARAPALAAAIFKKGDKTEYLEKKTGRWLLGTVVSIDHAGGLEPFYHIKIDGSSVERSAHPEQLRPAPAEPPAPTDPAALARAKLNVAALKKGDRVQYLDKKTGGWKMATVASVDHSGGLGPFLHIKVDGSFAERSATADQLRSALRSSA